MLTEAQITNRSRTSTSKAKTGLILLWVVCLIVPAFLGCEQINGSGIVQVIGEVRMDRKPLADAMVAFIPLQFRNDSGTIREIAFGRTDNAGRFELRTSETKGVSPTEYRVLFFRPDKTENKKKKSLTRSQVAEKIQVLQWSNDVLQGTALRPRPSMQLSEIDVGDIPATYNIESTLQYRVKLGAGILYPKFDLNSHPKN